MAHQSMKNLKTFSLDDETTWPQDVLLRLQDGFDTIYNYERRRNEIDSLGTANYVLAGMPDNPWRRERELLISEIEADIQGFSLIGYHCTRLVSAEIVAIRNGGLRPLSSDLLLSRISALVSAGLIDNKVGERLRAKNCSNDPNRRSRVWFVFSRETLRDEQGLWRLFGYWGGEALYNCHEDDNEMGPLLKRIGQPCIIVAPVPTSAIDTFMLVGERIVASYLERRNIRTRAGAEMEGYIQEPLPVQRVIGRAEAEFGTLTGCSEWSLGRALGLR
jgi:hypothetical protein